MSKANILQSAFLTVGLLLMPTTANAASRYCSQEAIDWKTNQIKQTREIEGRFELTSQADYFVNEDGERSNENDMEFDLRPMSGVVIANDGVRFEVEFLAHVSIITDGCPRFELPDGEAAGLFFLRPNGQDRYTLVHWVQR